MTSSDLDAARAALHADGYCHVRGVLDAPRLASVRALAADALGSVGDEHRAAYRSEGSLVPVADFPGFSALIADAAVHAVFAGLEFGDVRFSSGYVISKPPGGAPLFWHQDWWGWDEPASFTARIAQVFAFFYLTDTSPENGCLRVIPGSHRARHALHDLRDAHSDTLARVEDPAHRAFADSPGARAVPVAAGDVVIGDARLLHGAYANASDAQRTCVTLWWHPQFPSLPGPVRARLTRILEREGVDTDASAERLGVPTSWPEPHRSRVAPYLVEYAGDAAPQPWNRTPGAGLREPSPGAARGLDGDD